MYKSLTLKSPIKTNCTSNIKPTSSLLAPLKLYNDFTRLGDCPGSPILRSPGGLGGSSGLQGDVARGGGVGEPEMSMMEAVAVAVAVTRDGKMLAIGS